MPDRHLIIRPSSQPVAAPDRPLNAQIAQAQQAGILSAARLNAGAFAATVGLHRVIMLSQAADAAFRLSPLAENHYRDIVSAYGAFVTNEIQRLSFHDGGQS